MTRVYIPGIKPISYHNGIKVQQFNFKQIEDTYQKSSHESRHDTTKPHQPRHDATKSGTRSKNPEMTQENIKDKKWRNKLNK